MRLFRKDNKILSLLPERVKKKYIEMKFTAKLIAEYLKGEIIGNPEVEVYNRSKNRRR